MKKLSQKLPHDPGVYIFRGQKRTILYIGKATVLRTRVQSYFRRDIGATRGPIITGMVEIAKTVDYIKTDSVLEALILEAHLIKKYQPLYNTKEKSNKSFNYVVITKEEFPRVMTMRGRELSNLETRRPSYLDVGFPSEIKYSFGPFPQNSVLREALTIVRKIFPFRDKCKIVLVAPIGLTTLFPYERGELGKQEVPRGPRRNPALVAPNGLTRHDPAGSKICFNAQIGLCPGVCAGKISCTEYAKTIQRIKLFFEGKKPALLRSLENDMKHKAKELKFEDAARVKKTIFALNHIQDVALLKSDFHPRVTLGKFEPYRIEAYDVAHISGTSVVGVMVVLEDGEVKKSDYRKFKIKTSTNNSVLYGSAYVPHGADDNASLRELLSRRFGHTEWPMPNLIVVDGGKAQVNTAEKVLAESGLVIPVVGVVKDEHHKAREIIGENTKGHPRVTLGIPNERAILLANSEAHRFAIAYHRQLRGKILK